MSNILGEISLISNSKFNQNTWIFYLLFCRSINGREEDFFMQSLRKQQFERELVNHWSDVFFSSGKDVGFMAILDLENKDKPLTRYYKQQDLKQLLDDTKGKADRYISLNAFNRYSRKSIYVTQLRAIGIDIDQYKLGLTHGDVMREISYLVADEKIPMPNLVIKSRGIQIFYSINDGASVKMAWLQQYITGQIIKLLEKVGADAQANDLSRVLRVPESINSRNNSTVTPEITHNQAYTLDELRQYFPEIKRYRKSKQATRKNNVIPFQKLNLNNSYSKLNQNRTKDIEQLIQLRNGNMTNCRNTALYIYSFHASQSISKLETMIAVAKNTFRNVYSTADQMHMTTKELERTVKSAYEDGKAFQEHLKKNGYRIFNKMNDGIIKPYKTHSIIDKLSITVDEQEHLLTLVSTELAYKRRKEHQTANRRAKGIKPRNEYLKNHSSNKQARINHLKQLIQTNPNLSTQELMDALNISRRTLFNYFKELNQELERH